MPPSGPGVDVLDFRGGGKRFPRALFVSLDPSHRTRTHILKLYG